MAREYFIEEAYLEFPSPKNLPHILVEQETTHFNTKRSQAVLRAIGAALADQSYVMGEVRPGKGVGAGVDCDFGGYAKATLLLGVENDGACFWLCGFGDLRVLSR